MNPFKDAQITESSKKLYMSNLNRLLGKGFKNLMELKDTEKICKILDEKNINTRRTYYIAIVTALRDKKAFEKVLKIYYDKMQDTNKNKPIKDDEKTDKQKEKWIDFTELEDKQQSMENEVLSEIGKKRKISPELQEKLFNLVLISLYILQSPRRNIDYCLMKVGLQQDPKFNYIEGNKFYFNTYKTAGTYNQQVVDINPRLLNIINLYLKYRDSNTHFLVDGKKILDSSVKMNHKLNALLGVGSSMIRNSYATKYLKQAKDKLIQVGYDMGTSSGMLQRAYIKED